MSEDDTRLTRSDALKAGTAYEGRPPALYAGNLGQAREIAKVATHLFGGDEVQNMAILLRGQEMGIPGMTAIENIHIIEAGGKRRPFLSARLMAGLVRQSGKCASMSFRFEGEGSSRICIARGKRSDVNDSHEATATMKMKKNSPVWTNDPDKMLMARASSDLCRALWPEVILGMAVEGDTYHTQDESDAVVVEVPVEEESKAIAEEPAEEVKPVQKPAKKRKAKKVEPAEEAKPAELKEIPPANETEQQDLTEGDDEEDLY